MPTFLLITISIGVLVLILAGVVNFPYVPMWFGIYGAERYSARGRLVYALIWLFPLIAIVSLLIGWFYNGLWSLLPVAYFIITWLIRPNRHAANQPEKRYTEYGQNLNALKQDVDAYWSDWLENASERNYLLARVFTPDIEAKKTFLEASENLANKFGNPEISDYENCSASVYIQILLNDFDKEIITKIVQDLTNVAWEAQCEVWSIDIMEFNP